MNRWTWLAVTIVGWVHLTGSVLAAEPQSASIKLNLPPHPRLMLTDAEIPGIKARFQQSDLLKKRYEDFLRSADAKLKRKLDMPPRGGQWYHWYACKTDGANLVTVSPTQHKCPACGAIYTGWPYDDVVLSGIHGANGSAIRELGLAYRLSGEKKYAEKAKEILLAYADKYQSYPLHDKNGKAKVGGGHVGPQTLDEAVWLIAVCQGADLIWDRLSAAERKKIETDLLRPAADTIRRHKMKIHNIQCWKNSAVGLTGLLLDDPELVADAVTSEHGFHQQIAKGINGDGQWYEGAWGYHFYTMNAMSSLVEAGQRCGLKLYDYQSDGKSYRRLFDGPIDLAMPNLELPAFSDSSQVRVAGSQNLYELAYVHYKDPKFAEVLRAGKRQSLEAMLFGPVKLPDSPARPSASRDFTSAGYAVLQQGSGPDATWVCLKYGPHGGGHGHPDKLSFILYTHGKVLGYDPGTGKYGVPIHEGWQRTSIAHNTLTVDESNQKATTGQCLAFVEKSDWAAALADAGPIYAGVRYRRAVAIIGPDVVVVLDMADSQEDHRFDLAFHHVGQWTTIPQGEAAELPTTSGYQYLNHMVKVHGVLPTIDADSLKTGLAVASPQRGQLLAGDGAGNVSRNRVPCVLLRVQGKQAVAAWVLDLKGSVPTVQLVPSGTAWTINAQIRGKSIKFRVDPEGDEKLRAW
jgi:hypothetical protein